MRIPRVGELWKDKDRHLLIKRLRMNDPVYSDWIYYYIVDWDLESDTSLSSFLRYSNHVSG